MVASSSWPARSSHVLLPVALACAWWSLPTAEAQSTPADSKDAGLPGLLKEHALKVAAGAYLLCFLVASTEPAPPKEGPAGPLEQRKDASRVVAVSTFLSFVSGIVNAVAIIKMGGTVAHHTGNASHTGRLAGSDGARFGALMLAYLVGAGVAGFVKVDGEALFAGRYSAGMLSAAIAVVAGAAIHWAGGSALVALPLLAFSQGLQNAITRKCSSLPVCTTHMTGYLTDAGSGLGLWIRTGGGLPLKPRFFLLSISAFVAGGFAAKAMLDLGGILVTASVPVAGMVVAAFGLLGSSDTAKANKE